MKKLWIQILSFCVVGQMQLLAQQWYAGTWDSSAYNRLEHPKTVAVRIEVRDVDTGLPVKGATVEVKGEYQEETIGPGHFDGTPRRAPQRREYRLAAQTGEMASPFSRSAGKRNTHGTLDAPNTTTFTHLGSEPWTILKRCRPLKSGIASTERP